MSFELFIGVVVALAGVGLIFNILLKAHLPIFQIIIIFVFIYIGVRLIRGESVLDFKWTKNDVFLHRQVIHQIVGSSSEYNIICGKAVFDLSSLELKEKMTTVNINTVFSAVEIQVDKTLPVKVRTDVVFGYAQMPDHNSVGMGTSTYTLESFSKNQPYLIIKANVLFSSLNFKTNQ